ncbi:hypothetical protein H310_11180 [Aphanomyces invadans]|uniref:Uncharacterized protein n=1 Tax=Aphanomyces invadans TaxID=157072 RepID=A0A024TMP7_9STRA|nr:hypothetical protein H310_11180 [Aphanomyces invadans]ETV95279.1 hypothetical protein H310_11180 [Aphanomyces invadans]|eukprot:XP_008875980.1 hypothetical protein H310_11180 [Aphanomyces invadans]
MAITSDEVNFLVYRYLQESGFSHAAFTFAYESQLAKSSVISTEVPPGALISFIQKGLLYVGIEAHVNEDGTERECEADITLLNPHICRVAQSVSRGTSSGGKPGKRKRKSEEGGSLGLTSNSPDSVHDPSLTTTSNAMASATANQASPSFQTTNPTTDSAEAPDTTTTMIVLRGHEKDAYSCSWKPRQNTLVSGSSDATARIWDVPADFSTPATGLALVHGKDGAQSKDVTTLEWNADGSVLATGCYDGHMRLWSGTSGALLQDMHHHTGPVFAVRWNPSSRIVLSASLDSTVSLWDVASSSKLAQMTLHDGASILDAAWKDESTFATCSADTTIRLAKVGDTSPFVTWRGHTDEINAIQWSPSSTVLASCSDDASVKLWKVTDAACVFDFRDHTKEVYTVRWSPTGPGTAFPNRTAVLASASFDTTVRLWNVETGKCTSTLQHDNPVYAIAFSPNGEYVASGSISGAVQVWSMQTATVVKTFQGTGDIFEVSWNHDGTLISACYSTGEVVVIHFRV